MKRTPQSLAKHAGAVQWRRNEVAAYEKDAFVRRAGELIARAATNGKRKPAIKRAERP